MWPMIASSSDAGTLDLLKTAPQRLHCTDATKNNATATTPLQRRHCKGATTPTPLQRRDHNDATGKADLLLAIPRPSALTPL